MCGDFNIEPTTPTYKLLTQGKCSINPWEGSFKTLKTNEGEKPLYEIFGDQFYHNIEDLKSSYNTVLGKEPNYTNYTKTYTGCLDYIYYTCSLLEPTLVLDLPDELELTGFCPNKNYPSDHLSLKTTFVFIENK